MWGVCTLCKEGRKLFSGSPEVFRHMNFFCYFLVILSQEIARLTKETLLHNQYDAINCKALSNKAWIVLSNRCNFAKQEEHCWPANLPMLAYNIKGNNQTNKKQNNNGSITFLFFTWKMKIMDIFNNLSISKSSLKT